MKGSTEWTIREGVREACKAGKPGNHIVALCETPDVDHMWLTNLTTTPSGKIVGALRLGRAIDLLEDIDTARAEEGVA